MRILVFSTAYDPLIGGAELALAEITKRLPHHSFDILTARYSKNLPSFENRGHIKVYRLGFGLPFWDKHLFMFLAPLRALKLHAQNKYAFAWAIMANQAGVAALLFKKITGLQYLLTLQEGDSERWVRIRQKLSFGIYKKIYRHAAAIQTISNFLSQRARNFESPAPIFRIPNGLDLSLFKPADSAEKSALREKLGLPKDKFIVVTVSRLVEKNGVNDLLKAVARLPDIFLLIVGDGPLRGSLEKLAQQTGADIKVKFVGKIPYSEVTNYLRAADIFVRPSLSEGLGSAFLEAQACGLPVVATKVGGIPDIVENGFNGLFCRPSDPNDLSQQIKKLIDNKILYNSLRDNAIQFASGFDWSKIAAQMDKVFDSASNPKPRVLMAAGIYPPDIGGPASYAAKLVPALAERGLGVSVVTYADKALKNQKLKINNTNENFKTLDYLIYRIHRRHIKVLQYAQYFWRVFKLLPYYDLVYLQDLVSAGLPTALACKLRRKKYVLKIVGDYAWEQGVVRFGVKELLDDFKPWNYGWRVRLLRTLEVWVARGASHIVTPSNYLQDRVLSWQIRRPISVIYNAVDINTALSKELARKNLGLDENVKIVLSVGRLVPWKGFETLIRSAAELRSKFPDLNLFIIGDGPDYQKLQKLIVDLGASDYVKLLGKRDKTVTVNYMAAADIFALNSGYEGLPHTLIEAQACNTPVVASDVGGNREVVEHRKSGLIFTYNNQSGLKEALDELLENRSLRDHMVAEAQKAVENKFSFPVMIDSTIKLLEQEVRE